jgi:NADH-quinone oxidoreductase subunit G
LTVEEAYLLSTYIRKIDSEAILVVGPVPTIAEDESYPNGFTIHAEKCPNRKGVEAVVSKLSGQVIAFDDFIANFRDHAPDAIWITGGYKKSDWISAEAAKTLGSVKTLIVQDLFESAVWKQATIQLPGAAFAERQGSYVNFADQLQSFDWAVRSPAGVMVEGHLYARLLGRSGMYNARTVLQELAHEIPYFSAAIGEIPSLGVDLKINQLALG